MHDVIRDAISPRDCSSDMEKISETINLNWKLGKRKYGDQRNLYTNVPRKGWFIFGFHSFL